MDETVGTQDRAKIAFDGAFVEKATRADDPSTTTDNINEFYVWAIIDKAEGLVFDDERVWRSGDAWAYAETQYWTPGHTYYFSAIAGDRSNNQIDLDFAAANGMDVDGLGVATFKNVEGTNDFLYAEYKDAIEKPLAAAPEAVSFQFAHLLSKVKFTFENGFTNENSTIVIKNVEFAAPATGEIDLTADALAWENQNGSVTLNMGHLALGAHVEAGTSAATDNERLTIPAPATQEYTVEFDVEHHMGGVLVSEDHKTVKISGVEFLPGRAYNFQATINQDNVDEQPLYEIVFKVAVDEWVEETTNGYHFDYVSNTLRVESAEGLQAVAAAIESGVIENDANITLDSDIDLSQLATTTRSITTNWTPVGASSKQPFTGTFDGNGYKIKNFNYVVTGDDEAWYVGLFGYAKDATIKNLVMENVTIKSEKAYFAEVGAVVGHLTGTSTLENITITGDVKIEGNVDNVEASRIGAVVGGNGNGTITVKNVHVKANAGSYVKGGSHVGGIAGQLQVTNTFENCSTNIDVTAGRFFAGGIIGCAGQADTYTNCHTTGNVSVVAGRANNANDIHRVGGIAGGWSDGATKVLTLVDCSFKGTVSGKDLADNVAETFDYNGYVGRGYTLNNCEGSKVVIDGTEFVQVGNAAPFGVYTINGCNPVSTADELAAALAAGEGVYLLNDINMDVASKAGILVGKGKTATLILNGHNITATSTSTEGVQLFEVNGTLDVVGEGTISLTSNNFGWNASYRYTTINVREAGEVTLGEGVNVVCEASKDGEYGMSYAVDIYTTGKLNINGASLHSNYIAVRCFYGAAVVNVNSGSKITSSKNNYGIWLQSATGTVVNIADDVDYTFASNIYYFN